MKTSKDGNRRWQTSLTFIQHFSRCFSRRMAVTRFKLMLNILETLRILNRLGFSEYSRYIVSRCSSDMGGGGLNDGFMGKGYKRRTAMRSFVICTKAKKRTQLLYYLANAGVKQTCMHFLSLQEIVYMMQGHHPVGSTYFGNLLRLGLAPQVALVPQYQKLRMTIQHDEKQKR